MMAQHSRVSTTAMEYSQHAASRINIAANIGGAIEGLSTILIVAP